MLGYPMVKRLCFPAQRRVLCGLLCSLLVLLLLSGCGTSTGLFASGGNWQASPLVHRHIRYLAADPQNPQIIYAGDIQDGIFISKDGGGHWRPGASTTTSPKMLQVLAFDPAGKKLFAATRSGLFVSSDRAQSWTAVSTPKSGLPADDNNLTAFTFDYNTQNVAYIATARHGIFISHDDGVSWQTTKGAGLPEGEIISDLVYDPVLHQLWAAVPTGLYRSDDSGASWRLLNNGLPLTLTYLVVEPAAVNGGDKGLVFAGTDQGIFYSQDAGAHWGRHQESLAGTVIHQILLDFRSPSTVYVATNAGAFRSDDNAQNWRGVAPGLPRGKSVYALSLGGTDYKQLFAATEDVYLYPGTSGGFDITRVITLLLIVLGFFLFYRLIASMRRRPLTTGTAPSASEEISPFKEKDA